MNEIAKEQFLEAFVEEWQHQVNPNWEQIDDDWAARKRKGDHETPWTQFMLNEGGFLELVSARLAQTHGPLKYVKNFYYLDAVIVGGVDLYGSDLKYPSKLHAIIEHEAAENVEEETWKLSFWRSPFKILIFYDYDHHRRESTATKKWLKEKIPVLRDMIRKAEEHRGFPDTSEYLFIIGCRKSEHGEIYWQWTTDKEDQDLITLIGD